MSTPGHSERNAVLPKELVKALGPTGFFPGNKNVFSIPSQAAVPGFVERLLPEVLIPSLGWREGHSVDTNPVVPAHSQHLESWYEGS